MRNAPIGPGRSNIERFEVFSAQALVPGVNTFTYQMPVGEGIVCARLRFNHTLTVGTGSGAIADGELGITRAIDFRSDDGESFFKAVPGRGLHYFNTLEMGTRPDKDAVAAASATYRTDLALWFCDQRTKRPMDTVLDSSRYRKLTLAITHGTVADLLSTVGTASVVSTVDLVFFRWNGALPVDAEPWAYREVAGQPTVNPASLLFADFENAFDLAYKRILVGTHNSATLGTPWSGTAAANVLATIEWETNEGYPYRRQIVDSINKWNKTDYQLETKLTGALLLDVIGDGSLKSAIATRSLSRNRLTFTNDTLSASQISLMTDAVRDLRVA